MGIYYKRLRDLLNERHEFEDKINILEKYSCNSLGDVTITQVSNDSTKSLKLSGYKLSGESEAIETFIESLIECYQLKIQKLDSQIAKEFSKYISTEDVIK